MRIVLELGAFLFGCRATLPETHGTLYCTLRRRNHSERHEAWTCTCAGDGR